MNPYRQVTAIAADFARRGGRIVRDRVASMEVEGDAVRAVKGENATYTCDQAVICAGAWSMQLLAALGYALPLESQRGYHVMIPAPGIAVSRPVIAADRKVTERESELYRAVGDVLGVPVPPPVVES